MNELPTLTSTDRPAEAPADEPIRPSRRNAAAHRIWTLDPDSPWMMAWPGMLFIMLTFFVGADMAADVQANIGWGHLSIETVALFMGLAGIAGTGYHLRRSLNHAKQLQQHLHGAKADVSRWREEAEAMQAGLGAALDQQFHRWGLTAAQREVALLILKGLSYKEIAELRTTAEHTVRNQALSIFRKAGLTNRAEMAAFFLEDLLVPRQVGQRRSFGAGGEKGTGTDRAAAS